MQELWKDCAIFNQQKLEFHKLERANINFVEINLNFQNFVPKTTSIQLFHYFQTFPQLKIIFFWLEICERPDNCRVRILINVIKTNVNANSWIKNERKSSKKIFLLILISLSLISPLRHISSIPPPLKPYFASRSTILKRRQFDWSISWHYLREN